MTMAAFEANLTHPAFVSSRGKPVDTEARCEAVISAAKKWRKNNGDWPRRNTIAQTLNVHPSTISGVVGYLVEQDDVELEEGTGRVIVKNARAEEIMMMPPKKKSHVTLASPPTVASVSEEDTELGPLLQDEHYLYLSQSKGTLEQAVKEARAQLEPQERQLAGLTASLAQYIKSYKAKS